MRRLKSVLQKLLFPGTAVVILSVPISAALLYYTFAIAGDESPIAYISYMFSAWSLTVLCVAVIPMFRTGKRAVYRNKYVNRYTTDIMFKMKVSLYGSLCINILYVLLKLASGIYYGSVWFVTLAVYYGFLAVMRFLLLRHVNRNTICKDMRSEWIKYRICGILLLLMNIALSGMVVLVLHQEHGINYAGYLIYVMAMYAFYNITMAVINIVRYRRLGSPVLSAAKAIGFAAALVSMLAMETAMLEQFGADEPEFRQIMAGITGGGVCVIVMAMAIFMIVRSGKSLKNIKGAEQVGR